MDAKRSKHEMQTAAPSIGSAEKKMDRRRFLAGAGLAGAAVAAAIPARAQAPVKPDPAITEVPVLPLVPMVRRLPTRSMWSGVTSNG